MTIQTRGTATFPETLLSGCATRGGYHSAEYPLPDLAVIGTLVDCAGLPREGRQMLSGRAADCRKEG